MSFQKVKTYRSQKYLKFVRTKPCLSCGTTEGVQAAHVSFKNSGTGMKPPDSQTLPLCHYCHIEKEHRTGTLWEELNIDTKFEIIKLMTEFMSLNLKG